MSVISCNWICPVKTSTGEVGSEVCENADQLFIHPTGGEYSNRRKTEVKSNEQPIVLY